LRRPEAVPRIVFPNVEGDRARPIEISVRTPNPIDPARQSQLTAAEIETLHLDDIILACMSLRIPRLRILRSWSVDWGGGARPTLNGRSAQLAGVLAYLAGVRGRNGTRLRGWLRDTPTVWATGSLRLLEDPADPQVEPWSIDGALPDATMLCKFEAFAASAARVFFVPKSEVPHIGPRANQTGIQVVSVAEFGRLLKGALDVSVRYVVAVDVSELRAMVDAVLEGVFPRGPGFWLANAFTAVRVPCGVVAAWLAFRGQFNDAASLYVAGLLTDVADGVAARYLHGTSEFGKKFDRQTDMAFNFVVGLGMIAGWAHSPHGIAKTVALLALTVGLMAASRLLGAQPGSGVAKLRSGWIRAVLLVFIVLHMDWSLSAARLVSTTVAALALVGVSLYEIDQVCRDVPSGRRGWLRKRPKTE